MIGGLDRSRLAGAGCSCQASMGSGTNEPFSNGVPGQVDSVMNPQGLHDSVFMAVDRFDRDVHLASDVFNTQAVRQMPQDFEFPIAELRQSTFELSSRVA